MREIILAGCENTKRTDYFLKAAQELGASVRFENLFECIPENIAVESDKTIVKLDPYVYQTSELNNMEGALDKYSALLKCFESCGSFEFLNRPSAILQVLDKVKCKQILMDSNIPTTDMIAYNVRSVDELKELMVSKRQYAVFIKPVRSSGAVGIMAYRFQSKTNKESLYTSAYLESGNLINTKKLYHIEDSEQIRTLLEKVLCMETMVERWYSKAHYKDRKYDLRVVWQFGKIDFVVARQSKGPITNLHLNNQALSVGELGLSDEKWSEIALICDNAMKQFPGLNSAGIDVMLEKGSLKPRIIEINGQGDLIYQDIFNENKIYKNQILYMAK